MTVFHLQDDITGGTSNHTDPCHHTPQNGAQRVTEGAGVDGLAGFRDAILRAWRICQDEESDVAWVTVSETLRRQDRKIAGQRKRDQPLTPEERERYNANRRAKQAQRTPEQRAAFNAARNAKRAAKKQEQTA